MAGTKRVQFFIDRFNEKKIPVSVITIGNFGDSKSGNNSKGVSGTTKFFNYGASLPASLISYFFLPLLILLAGIKILVIRKSGLKNILYVYNSISVDSFLVVLFARGLGYKVVADIVEDYRVINENISFPLRIKYKLINFFEGRIHLFCDRVVVLSSYLKDFFVKQLNVKIPVELIPVSSNLKAESKSKEKFHSPLKISYTGSFAKKDGLQFLINAFNEFSKKFTDSQLLLTGIGNNPQKLVEDSKNSKIKYIGYLSDEEYYNFLLDADILCMTRLNTKFANAGFPFKLGEYLATGNPVVVTDVSDISDYLENNIDAKIVPPENSHALCAALTEYAEDFKAASKIGERGKEKALKFFNYQINGDKLIDLMKKI